LIVIQCGKLNKNGRILRGNPENPAALSLLDAAYHIRKDAGCASPAGRCSSRRARRSQRPYEKTQMDSA